MNEPKHPDMDRATRIFILNRAKALVGELLGRLTSAAQNLERDDYRTVLGELALAEIQLQHFRAIIRLLAT